MRRIHQNAMWIRQRCGAQICLGSVRRRRDAARLIVLMMEEEHRRETDGVRVLRASTNAPSPPSRRRDSLTSRCPRALHLHDPASPGDARHQLLPRGPRSRPVCRMTPAKKSLSRHQTSRSIEHSSRRKGEDAPPHAGVGELEGFACCSVSTLGGAVALDTLP
jgi:hypothetical protein